VKFKKLGFSALLSFCLIHKSKFWKRVWKEKKLTNNFTINQTVNKKIMTKNYFSNWALFCFSQQNNTNCRAEILNFSDARIKSEAFTSLRSFKPSVTLNLVPRQISTGYYSTQYQTWKITRICIFLICKGTWDKVTSTNDND